MFTKITHFALSTAFFGILSFILGIIAELRKPASGNPIQGKGVIICSFPRDPSITLGFLSIVTIFIATIFGAISIFKSYKGKSVPSQILFKNTLLNVLFNISIGLTIGGAGMTLWATVTELMHHVKNVHFDLATTCPTAKTGLFGGAAFIHLNATLFWILCQMLTGNVREDHFRNEEDDDDVDQSAY
ncbi:hypothetical protein LUZ60_011103 [Juncus effusus]|nr:hypothetical protein LUZ60_011103 [Juncus effusus]